MTSTATAVTSPAVGALAGSCAARTASSAAGNPRLFARPNAVPPAAARAVRISAVPVAVSQPKNADPHLIPPWRCRCWRRTERRSGSDLGRRPEVVRPAGDVLAAGAVDDRGRFGAAHHGLLFGRAARPVAERLVDGGGGPDAGIRWGPAGHRGPCPLRVHDSYPGPPYPHVRGPKPSGSSPAPPCGHRRGLIGPAAGGGITAGSVRPPARHPRW